MAQEPVYDFEYKLASGITVKWQLNPIRLEIKDESVPCEPVLRSDSVLRQFERYDWKYRVPPYSIVKNQYMTIARELIDTALLGAYDCVDELSINLKMRENPF